MVANIAVPTSRPKTDQAFMTNFLRTQTEYTPHPAERWLNGASSTDPYLMPPTHGRLELLPPQFLGVICGGHIGADAEVTHDGIPIARDMALICSTA